MPSHTLPEQNAELLSVVVVNWNSRDDLAACLDSLKSQTYPHLEVIVVDNGSADGSVEMMRERYDWATLLPETENLGFAEGCNRGITASTGAWVAMLNNDAVAQPGWAEALMKAAGDAPSHCGMLQSLMLYLERPDTINSTGIELTPRGGRDRYDKKPRNGCAPPQAVFCPTAGAAAYRRSMLEAIKIPGGYFDRTHFMYYEDLDLGWRARLAGYEARFVPESVVHHRYHASTKRRKRSWLEVIGRRNRMLTMTKNASWRFMARGIHHSCIHMVQILWHGGPSAVVDTAKAIRHSAAQRDAVSSIAVVSRRDVEREWVVSSRSR